MFEEEKQALKQKLAADTEEKEAQTNPRPVLVDRFMQVRGNSDENEENPELDQLKKKIRKIGQELLLLGN